VEFEVASGVVAVERDALRGPRAAARLSALPPLVLGGVVGGEVGTSNCEVGLQLNRRQRTRHPPSMVGLLGPWLPVDSSVLGRLSDGSAQNDCYHISVFEKKNDC
jgi:hypothetical protein